MAQGPAPDMGIPAPVGRTAADPSTVPVRATDIRVVGLPKAPHPPAVNPTAAVARPWEVSPTTVAVRRPAVAKPTAAVARRSAVKLPALAVIQVAVATAVRRHPGAAAALPEVAISAVVA